MFANMLMRLGVYVIALDAIFLFVAEARFDAKPYDTVKYVAMAGVGLIALGMVLRILQRASTKISLAVGAGKCVKCGIRLPKGHRYCTLHAQDLTRT